MLTFTLYGLHGIHHHHHRHGRLHREFIINNLRNSRSRRQKKEYLRGVKADGPVNDASSAIAFWHHNTLGHRTALASNETHWYACIHIANSWDLIEGLKSSGGSPPVCSRGLNFTLCPSLGEN